MATAFRPESVAATVHVANLVRSKFEAENFMIAEAEDGSTLMGPSSFADFDEGTSYRFFGRWEDSKYGYRFRFHTFAKLTPLSRRGVIKYLSTAPGIGAVTAGKLFDRYKQNTISQIRDLPATVAEECGLNLEAILRVAELITEDEKYQETKVELCDLFAGRGFSSKITGYVLAKWKQAAPAVIKADPFALIGIPSAGFKRVDKLYLDLDHDPAALIRQVHCAIYCIAQNYDGHTWQPAEAIVGRLLEFIPDANPLEAFRHGIKSGLLEKIKDDHGKTWITSRKFAADERAAASHLRRIAANRVLWPIEEICESTSEGDGLPSAHQLEQLRKATAGGIGAFVGVPGSGKTHTLAYLLKAVIKKYGAEKIKVIAPTGRAAVRCTEALESAGVTGIRATTIHTALIQCGAMGFGTSGGFTADEKKFARLDCSFLICDEFSMPDIELAANLFKSVGSDCNVLLVGDPNQLPPIGHGAPLRDILESSIPIGQLTEVRRNSGRIVSACLQIKAGQMFDDSPKLDLDAVPAENLKIYEAASDKESIDTLTQILTRMKTFDPVNDTQIVVAKNKGNAVARFAANQYLQNLLNPDGKSCAQNPFRIGDKIVCMKNDRFNAVEKIGYAPDVVGNYGDMKDPIGKGSLLVPITNGEIGRVIAIAPKQVVALFPKIGSPGVLIRFFANDGGNEDAKAGDEEDTGSAGNFELGYAVTTHKLQGGSAPLVIVLVDSAAGMVTSREWIYTAISRASRACLVIGQRSTIAKMIARKSSSIRKTFLADLVVGGLLFQSQEVIHEQEDGSAEENARALNA